MELKLVKQKLHFFGCTSQVIFVLKCVMFVLSVNIVFGPIFQKITSTESNIQITDGFKLDLLPTYLCILRNCLFFKTEFLQCHSRNIYRMIYFVRTCITNSLNDQSSESGNNRSLLKTYLHLTFLSQIYFNFRNNIKSQTSIKFQDFCLFIW